MSIRLVGRAAAPGVAIAPAFVVTSQPALTGLPEAASGAPEEETARLLGALHQAEEELHELAKTLRTSIGEEEAEIFEAQAEFAADPELVRMAAETIAAGASAERAVVEAFRTFRELLAMSESEYLAARVTDLDDVRDRVVRTLLGLGAAGDRPEIRSVIVARELSPSQTASIPIEAIAALVTETGSPTSHAAILARALGVPAVVACEGLVRAVRPGVDVAVDGRVGEAIVDPDPAEREAAQARGRE